MTCTTSWNTDADGVRKAGGDRLRPTGLDEAATLRLPAAVLPDEEIDQLAARDVLLICPSGVLYDDTLWWRWLLRLLARMGLYTHRQAFWELWRRDYYDAVCRGERSYWDALQEFLLAAGLSHGQTDEVCAAGRPRWRLFHEQLRPFPHVPAALAALSASGFTIAVVAHSPEPASELTARYEQMGLARFVTGVVTSRDLGCGPSDPLFAGHALARLELSAAQTALVTHDPPPCDGDSGLLVARIAVDGGDPASSSLHFECLDELTSAVIGQVSQRRAG